MNRFVAHLQVGFFPAVATAYPTQLQYLDELAKLGGEDVVTYVTEEKQRYVDGGYPEASRIWLDRAVEAAKAIGIGLTVPERLDGSLMAWGNDVSAAVRGQLNDANVTHQPFLMVHAGGTILGEVANYLNLLMFTVRYLMWVQREALLTQWSLCTDELTRLAVKAAETFTYSGMPGAFKSFAETVPALVTDIVRYPQRVSDVPYLNLLHGHIRRELFTLLDAVEDAEAVFAAAAPAPAFGTGPLPGR